MKIFLACVYENLCTRWGQDVCRRCANNKARNKMIDCFEPCEDSDYSASRMSNGKYKAKQNGSAEHGGLECPACHYLNNAYTFDEKENFECEQCGLPLTCSNH